MTPQKWMARAVKVAGMATPFAAILFNRLRRRRWTTSKDFQTALEAFVEMATTLSAVAPDHVVFADREAYFRDGLEASIKRWALQKKETESRADAFLRRYFRPIFEQVIVDAAPIAILGDDGTVAVLSSAKLASVVARACVEVPVRFERQGILDRNYGEGVTGQPRHPRWPSVRREHLLQYPMCEACGTTDQLVVHHIRPFALNPQLEIEPDNLLTLCSACHLSVGHCGDFRRENPNVVEDAAIALAEVRRGRPAE